MPQFVEGEDFRLDGSPETFALVKEQRASDDESAFELHHANVPHFLFGDELAECSEDFWVRDEWLVHKYPSRGNALKSDFAIISHHHPEGLGVSAGATHLDVSPDQAVRDPPRRIDDLAVF
jgi:hypothetical protein